MSTKSVIGKFMMVRPESANSCFDRSSSAFVDGKGSVRRKYIRG